MDDAGGASGRCGDVEVELGAMAVARDERANAVSERAREGRLTERSEGKESAGEDEVTLPWRSISSVSIVDTSPETGEVTLPWRSNPFTRLFDRCRSGSRR